MMMLIETFAIIITRIRRIHNLQNAVGHNRLRRRCHHLANWTKHWFWPIPCIIWKPDVINKTGSTS